MLKFDGQNHPLINKLYSLPISVSFLSKRKNFTYNMESKLKKKGFRFGSYSFVYYSKENKLAKMKVTCYFSGIFAN